MSNKEAKDILTSVKNTPQVTWTNGADVAFDLAIKALERDTDDLSDYSDKLWKLAYERGKADRPSGEWIFDSEFAMFGSPYGTYRCSCCGGHSSDKYSFCKDCGADMRGGAE